VWFCREIQNESCYASFFITLSPVTVSVGHGATSLAVTTPFLLSTVEQGDGIIIRSSLISVAHQWRNHHASCDCGARGQRLPNFFFVFTAGRNLLQPSHAGVD